MTQSYPRIVALALLSIVTAVAGCRTASREVESGRVQPAARRDAGGSAASAFSPDTVRRGHPADVRFMQDMIAHHAQALVMTSLVRSRTSRSEMRLLAERIDVSQRDEIALMRQWLTSHGQEAPSADPQHAHHGAAGRGMMPGMLTEDDLAQLSRATGAAFDRLFLQLMIRHHEGALTMVTQLFATPGAAQETEVYRLATDVDADQRAEIARMHALLRTLPAR
ncbi:MAG: DUF305 domain-containing protein [Gemmatimonadaceae bacterium]